MNITSSAKQIKRSKNTNQNLESSDHMQETCGEQKLVTHRK